MNKWRVSFEVEIPEGIKMKDFMDWIKYRLGVKGSISIFTSNPLHETEIEAKSISILQKNF